MCSKLLAAIPALLIVGCSIKVDREECLSHVSVDLSQVPYSTLLDEGYDCLQICVRQGEWCGYEMLMLEDRPEGLDMPAPRGEVTLSAFCGARREFRTDRGLVIPEGSQAPALLLFKSSPILVGEDGIGLGVALHKEFCRLRLVVANNPGYILRVEGGVDGYDTDWKPTAGRFSTDIVPDGSGVCSVVLPRQLDDEMGLCILRGPRILRGFALGRFMRESGYDWGAEELEDITLKVDYSTSTAVLSSDKWSHTYEYDIEL